MLRFPHCNSSSYIGDPNLTKKRPFGRFFYAYADFLLYLRTPLPKIVYIAPSRVTVSPINGDT